MTRNRAMAPIALLCAFVSCIVVLQGCASRGAFVRGDDEEADWEVACEAPSLQTYSRFAHTWPKSSHLSQIDRATMATKLYEGALALVDGDPGRVVEWNMSHTFVLGNDAEASFPITLSEQDLLLFQLPSGQVLAKGHYEMGLGGGPSVWTPLTQHTLYGTFVDFCSPGVSVLSDPTDPLKFYVDLVGGYVFERVGRGAFFVPAGLSPEIWDSPSYDRELGTVYLFNLP